MSYKIDRKTYAQTYGPTTGDRVRLADTELFIEVERDLTTYGDEVKFGGGKVIRDGMGQSQVTRGDGAVDTVITNALIVDWWGIIKADVGLKDGKIFEIGKAGNPDIQDKVNIVIGPGSYGSANGTGTDASFSAPYGVAIDSDGNIIVADTENHLIRKIDGSTYEVTLSFNPKVPPFIRPLNTNKPTTNWINT